MKINKIKSISKLGQYIDFEWPDGLDEFRRYNFFYGWNYSGKTSLSRIFRCLELHEVHCDYPDLNFSLLTEEGKTITNNDIVNDYSIRVFNEDFIEDNFAWNNENAEINPVIVLGKESRELEHKLKAKQNEKSKADEEIRKKKKQKADKERELDGKLTDKASEIRRILSITNPRDFDKTKLEDKVQALNSNYEANILSDDVAKLRDTLLSKKLEKIDTISVTLKLSSLIENIGAILKQEVTAQKIIEKLNQNLKLSEWVKEGIELHKNETICQFCGSQLREERLDELNKHFSREFNNLLRDIDSKEDELNNHKNYIEKLTIPDKARLYNEYQKEYETAFNRFKQITSAYAKAIDILSVELRRKKANPFTSLQLDSSINAETEDQLTLLIDEINQYINQHNNRIDILDTEKGKARQKLLTHYTAEFVKERTYFTYKRDISSLTNEIRNLNKKISEIQREISDIEREINASAIGAERINKYLKTFFGDDRLQIQLTEKGNYKLYRNDMIAKNLSTGEKNIISLIYFFAKLEESNFNFQDAVIFIDDPVSSLDANHTHRVYAFISTKFKECGQLFITTHNFDFFNLLKDMYKYELRNQAGSFYLIKKISKDDGYCSTIENIPKLLLKFKSEYNYLFYILKTYDDFSDKSQFEQLYIIPNILRRFLELYVFMKYPDGKKYNKKVEKLFLYADENKKLTTLKIADEYSHEENPEHATRFPDINEISIAVNFTLETLKNQDSDHFQALLESIDNTAG